jgi:hypothetical protein
MHYQPQQTNSLVTSRREKFQALPNQEREVVQERHRSYQETYRFYNKQKLAKKERERCKCRKERYVQGRTNFLVFTYSQSAASLDNPGS